MCRGREGGEMHTIDYQGKLIVGRKPKNIIMSFKAYVECQNTWREMDGSGEVISDGGSVKCKGGTFQHGVDKREL